MEATLFNTGFTIVFILAILGTVYYKMREKNNPHFLIPRQLLSWLFFAKKSILLCYHYTSKLFIFSFPQTVCKTLL